MMRESDWNRLKDACKWAFKLNINIYKALMAFFMALKIFFQLLIAAGANCVSLLLDLAASLSWSNYFKEQARMAVNLMSPIFAAGF